MFIYLSIDCKFNYLVCFISVMIKEIVLLLVIVFLYFSKLYPQTVTAETLQIVCVVSALIIFSIAHLLVLSYRMYLKSEIKIFNSSCALMYIGFLEALYSCLVAVKYKIHSEIVSKVISA